MAEIIVEEKPDDSSFEVIRDILFRSHARSFEKAIIMENSLRLVEKNAR